MADNPGLVLLTGAAGGVASVLRPALRDQGIMVRLTDRVSVRPLFDNEEYIRGRLEKEGHMRRACKGISALVHLGAAATEQGWDDLIRSNVSGLTNCFEAARAAGARRFIFASSMHSVGMHPRQQPVDEASSSAPDSRYATTKLFGEALCQLFAAKYQVSVTAIRIGHMVDKMPQAAPGQGVAAVDVARIFMLALSFDTAGFRLLHAVAPHLDYPLTDGRLQDEHGFTFSQHGPDRATILRRVHMEANLNLRAKEHHGGYYAGLE